MQSRTVFLLGVAAGVTAAGAVASFEEVRWRREQRQLQDLERRATKTAVYAHMYGKPTHGKTMAVPLTAGDVVYVDLEGKSKPFMAPEDLLKDVFDFLQDLSDDTSGLTAPQIREEAMRLVLRSTP
jgi:hypothetical protein